MMQSLMRTENLYGNERQSIISAKALLFIIHAIYHQLSLQRPVCLQKKNYSALPALLGPVSRVLSWSEQCLSVRNQNSFYQRYVEETCLKMPLREIARVPQKYLHGFHPP